MPANTPGGSRGLLESLKALGSTLLAVAHTRLDLLSVDLEEQLAHFFALLVLTLVALFWLGIGVVLVVVLLIEIFWDTHRLPALSGLAGFFLVVGTAVWVVAARKANAKPRLFASSLAELGKDRQQFIPPP